MSTKTTKEEFAGILKGREEFKDFDDKLLDDYYKYFIEKSTLK